MLQHMPCLPLIQPADNLNVLTNWPIRRAKSAHAQVHAVRQRAFSIERQHDDAGGVIWGWTSRAESQTAFRALLEKHVRASDQPLHEQVVRPFLPNSKRDRCCAQNQAKAKQRGCMSRKTACCPTIRRPPRRLNIPLAAALWAARLVLEELIAASVTAKWIVVNDAESKVCNDLADQSACPANCSTDQHYPCTCGETFGPGKREDERWLPC